jgi:hypothetical protein
MMRQTRPHSFIKLLVALAIITSGIYSNVCSATSSGQQDTVPKQATVKQPEYTTIRLTTAKPVIDGKLDDECWKTGEWAGNWTQFIPNEGAKPSYPTEMKILYDDRNLYVAFRAFDKEPGKIKRMAGVRDEFAGDMIGVNFDSYRDYRTGFEFTITAWGQKIDLILFNPDNWDVNWQAVWKGKVGTEDSAWVAELEIPFSQVRYSGKDEQVWGLHAWRWVSRLQEESDWEKQTKTGPGIIYNFGELKGIKGLKKSRRFELMPYSLGELKTMEKTEGDPFTEKGRSWGGNIGLDAKVGISSNFTLDLTVNPDFGQVESDPSVMNLTAFETYYQEKRPFFLEGLTIFNYDFDNQYLFYSRRIGHSPSYTPAQTDSLFVKSPNMTTILSAAKFSGTTSDGLSVGLIQSLTGPEYAKISDRYGNTTTIKVEPLTSYTVARVQKGFNAGTTVLGGMLTSTNRFGNDGNLNFLTDNAYTGGLDLITRWKDKEYFLDARLVGSFVDGSSKSITDLQESSARYYQRPDAGYLNYDTSRTNLGGYGGKLKIGKGSKGFWRYATGISWLSPGLELNDIGYMTTVDQIDQQNEVSYFVNQPVSIFRTYNIKLEEINSWNFNATNLGSLAHLSLNSEFKNQWSFIANVIYHTPGYDTRILRGGYDMLMPAGIMASGTLASDQSKRITAGMMYNYQSIGNSAGATSIISPFLSVRPFMSLMLSISATYEDNRNDLQYVSTESYYGDPRYILGTIKQKTLGLTFRVDLNITPEFSIQYYGSPFVSRGIYSEFKRVTDPGSKEYSDRFKIFTDPVLTDGRYYFDENNDLTADYSVANPDFNFHQFRSNLVAKWEYRLGSFIYFVWSSERTGLSEDPSVSMGDSFKQLKKVFPDNIFLIKLNYWFSL